MKLLRIFNWQKNYLKIKKSNILILIQNLKFSKKKYFKLCNLGFDGLNTFIVKNTLHYFNQLIEY
jgi:hypothetical protein